MNETYTFFLKTALMDNMATEEHHNVTGIPQIWNHKVSSYL